MNSRRIIEETAEKIVYEPKKKGVSGQVCHYYKDTYRCPETGADIEIPGRGAMVNRFSALMFSRLRLAGIESHFLQAVNMRESMMRETQPFPLKAVLRLAATGTFAKQHQLLEGQALDRPIIDFYRSTGAGDILVSESQLVSFGFLEAEDLEDIGHSFIRTVDVLRGMFLGVGMNLMEITLSLGRIFSDEEDSDEDSPGGEALLLTGEISPETLCVMDLETNDFWGEKYLFSRSEHPAHMHYQKLASRMGVHLGGPLTSRVIPFSPMRAVERATDACE